MRAVTLAVLGALTCAQTVQAGEVPLPAKQIQTFNLFSQGHQLEQPLVVYRHGARTLVPLQALSAALGFDIQVNPNTASASGWIVGENANFMLDLNQDEARRGFERYELDPERPWGRDSADLYLDAELIQQLLPLTLSFNRPASRLSINSPYPLPAVVRLEEQQQQLAQLGLQHRFHSAGFDPIHPHVYEDFSDPMVFAYANAAVLGEDMLSQDYQLGLISTGDVLGQSYEFNYTKLANERSEYRLRFSRDLGDVSENLPLNLGRYQAGDISYLGDNLLHGASEGLGFQISNLASTKSNRFGTTALEGNAPPDWQIHLYRNGVLLAFTRADSSGRYRFLDVPLINGANVFELHLYGNNGEHHMRRETIQSGQHVGKGEVGFNAMYLDNTQFVFNSLRPDEEEDLGARRQFALRADYGLTNRISAGISYHQQQLAYDDWGRVELEDRHYLGANLAADLFGGSWVLEGVRDDEGNNAYMAGWNTRVGSNHHFRLNHRYNGDMRSDRVDQQDRALKRETEAWFEGQTWRLGGWQYAFGAAHNAPQDGGEAFSVYQNRLSTRVGPLNFSHTYFYDTQYDDRLARQSGELLFTTSGYDWNLSGRAEYQWGYGVEEMETRLHWRPYHSIYNQTLLWYADPVDRKSRYGIGHEIAYRFRWLTLGLQGGIDTRGNWQVNTTATVAINYKDNRDGAPPEALRPQLSDLVVRVFVDANNNGHFDRNDLPLSGVAINTAPSWPREVSDDQGEILLRQVPSTSLYRIDIDPRQLPPGMALRDGPLEVMPMAGQRTEVDLALVRVTDIDGTLVTRHGPVSGLTLTLADLEHQPVHQTRSSADGQFQMNGIRPGNYYLVLDDGQLKREGLKAQVPLYPVNIGSQGEPRRDWTIELEILPGSPHGPSVQVAQTLVEPEVIQDNPVVTPVASLPPPAKPLSRMADDDYTLQLSASREAFNLPRLKRQFPALSLEQITVMRGGRPMHLLLSGQYPSVRSAQFGMRDLPKEFANDLPIVRRVGDLKREAVTPSAPAKPTQAASPRPATDTGDADAWLAAQPAGNLTWQLAATKARSSAEAFIRNHQLPQPVVIHQHNGWYQILWGSFDDRASANAALKALPNAPQNPWLRGIGGLR
ncbi:SPOR domain-containing protein [Ferrimonas balearica]|uniref:SPOR domain-containing protein n=1 Tax=Ferrimonas balearica TaxID=44012 RepID=UPI001C99E0E0|nr:SPOR domain-containing protein [Ferrimonas balearica]MBY5993559.1 SPOR domain-containing protein [Ferrimonas balearica]